MTAWLVVVLATVALAVVELSVRAWIRFRGAYCVCPPNQRLRLHLDRDTLPELDPIARFDVNSDGERGGEVPRARRGETLYRVLVAGGSQPEGYLLDQDVNWPGALAAAPLVGRRISCRARRHTRSRRQRRAIRRRVRSARPHPLARASAISAAVRDRDSRRRQRRPALARSTARRTHRARSCRRGSCSAAIRKVRSAGRRDTLAITELARRIHRRLRRPERVHAQAGRWLRKARAMRGQAKIVRAAMPNPGAMLDPLRNPPASRDSRARSRTRTASSSCGSRGSRRTR